MFIPKEDRNNAVYQFNCKDCITRTIKEAIYSEENEHHLNGISFKLESKAKKTTAKTTTSSNWVHKGPSTSIVPYRYTTKVNQSETTIKYFDPLRTHKYDTHTHLVWWWEKSLETSPKNIVIQDMINSENSTNTTESTNTNILKCIFCCNSVTESKLWPI